MEFMTTKVAVEKWNISERRIRQLLQDGRIEGAVKVGNSWNIPIDAEKPVDKRIIKPDENSKIGIDMGINNVGWSILNNDTNKIEEYGVRLFSESSDASERRATRNNRRRMKRKDTRLNDTIKLLRNIGFNNEVSCDNNMIEKRVKGLNEQIDKQDIVSVEDCVKVSELINPILDKEDPIDGSYVLDVSSVERG